MRYAHTEETNTMKQAKFMPNPIVVVTLYIVALYVGVIIVVLAAKGWF